MHKSYLLDLEADGVRIAPTKVLHQGSDVRELDALEWDDVVIKPAISGSSFGAARFSLSRAPVEAQRHLTDLLSFQDVLIQPFIAEVERARERAFVFVGGVFSHAVLKTPFSAGVAAGQSTEALYDPTAEELTWAQSVINVASAHGHLSYARVDFTPFNGLPHLMELELIEPNLFLRFSPQCAARLADELIRA
jgi:glutathione synthase/RimK-type ligase-like ATP-grasp enzyme